MLENHARYLAWIAFCVLIAFALRTYRLDLQSFWYDEGVTVDIARRTLPDLTRWTAQDIQPPLYYYVVSGWGKLLQGLAWGAPGISDLAALLPAQQLIPFLWGGAWSEWSVRFVSVFFGTLTVPLMAGLAIRLTRQRMAGAIAALLTAVHPWLFYYSQEARMYAMLTFLGVLAGYVLFGGFREREEESGEREREREGVRSVENEGTRWGLYVVVATAAVYTHYFAFFLLVALGLGYLARPVSGEAQSKAQKSWPPRTEKNTDENRSSAFISAHVTILILYIPWFVALFAQLRGDSSYWQGDFKISEAIRKVAIGFAGGETVTAEIGLWLLIPIGLLTITSIIALAWIRPQTPYPTDRSTQPPATSHPCPERRRREPLATLLLWWLLPTASILLLALFIPKFNPRYAILSLPGLILLWSAGLSRMIILPLSFGRSQIPNNSNSSDSALNQSTHHAPRIMPTLLSAILLIVCTTIFLYADRNYFTDPEFTKTQWRPLTNYVRKRIPPEDAVVLTSGHTWPIWNYYAPNVLAVSIPRLRILDVNSVLDYPTAGSLLGNALVGKQGAWLVSWQDEVVDPMDVVPLYLERAGSEVPSERDYWDISLRRFEKLDVDQLRPDLGAPVAVNYGNQLVLRGFDTHSTGELLLFWQRHPAYKTPQGKLDLRLTGQLRTPDGLIYASFEDQPLTVEAWPTEQWQPEQLVVSKVPAAVWAGLGALPGAYGLMLGLYDPAGDLGGYDILNEQGQPMGKQRTLPVSLVVPTQGPLAQPTDMAMALLPTLYAAMRFDGTGFDGTGSDGTGLSGIGVESGQSLPLSVEWLATDGIAQSGLGDNAALRFSWRTEDRESVAQALLPIAPEFPIAAWPPGQKLRTRHRLQTDSSLAPGLYDLFVSVGNYDTDNDTREVASTNSISKTDNLVAKIQFLPSTRTFDVPALAQPIEAEFGGQIALRGLLESVSLPSATAAEGRLTLSLVWQAIAPPQRDYTVSVQLLDAEKRPVSQTDLQLPGGSASWLSEQVAVQTVELTIPDGMADGTTGGMAGSQIIAVIYDASADGLPRLLRQDGTGFVIIALASPPSQ